MALAADDGSPPPPLRVGRVTVVTDDIFTDEEVTGAKGPDRSLRKIMNGLHIKTRERIVRRELLFEAGDAFDPALLAETERNLRSLGFVSEVRVTALDTLDDGTVDVLVRSRDAWSLRANLGFNLASGGDQRWNLSLSDVNFLGYGVTMGAGIGSDEDRDYWQLWYRQRRLFGSAFWFGVDFYEATDGYRHGVYLGRPFYAMDDRWSTNAAYRNGLAEVRYYLSNGGEAGADPTRTQSLHTRIPRNTVSGELDLLMRVSRTGQGRVWRMGLGLNVEDNGYDLAPSNLLSDGRTEDLSYLEEDGEITRHSGTRVFPMLVVSTLGRDWAKARFAVQYGAVEDIPLNAALELRTGPAGGGVGSTTAFSESVWRSELTAVRWWQAGRGMIMAQAGGYADVGPSVARSHSVYGVAGWMGRSGAENTPWLQRIFVEGANGHQIDGSKALILGLDRGLRTLQFDGMAGDRLVRWTTELGKVSPWETFGLFRMGGAAFYNGGMAWWRDEDRDAGDIRHELGCGLRFGPTRAASSQIARVDISWALDGSVGPVLTAVTRGYF